MRHRTGQVDAPGSVVRCPSWVNRVAFAVGRLLPVFPVKWNPPPGPVSMSKSANTGSRLPLCSFGQPGSPQSFFVSREIVGPPRAQHGFEGGNTERGI